MWSNLSPFTSHASGRKSISEVFSIAFFADSFPNLLRLINNPDQKRNEADDLHKDIAWSHLILDAVCYAIGFTRFFNRLFQKLKMTECFHPEEWLMKVRELPRRPKHMYRTGPIFDTLLARSYSLFAILRAMETLSVQIGHAFCPFTTMRIHRLATYENYYLDPYDQHTTSRLYLYCLWLHVWDDYVLITLLITFILPASTLRCFIQIRHHGASEHRTTQIHFLPYDCRFSSQPSHR